MQLNVLDSRFRGNDMEVNEFGNSPLRGNDRTVALPQLIEKLRKD